MVAGIYVHTTYHSISSAMTHLIVDPLIAASLIDKALSDASEALELTRMLKLTSNLDHNCNLTHNILFKYQYHSQLRLC